VFAGPNGSGKTSLFQYLLKIHAFNVYHHINPDQIAADMRFGFNISNWPLEFSTDEFLSYLDSSSFQKLVSFRFAEAVRIQKGILSLKPIVSSEAQAASGGVVQPASLRSRPEGPHTSYLYAALGDFLRRKMLDSDSSFSFETVFSHPSKIDELRAARENGFITYLYVIATKNPSINLERIRNRVERGGHDVPEEKTVARYQRTMENICAAFLLANRVYFFDNSVSTETGAYQYFAEKRDDRLLIHGSTVPEWFEKNVLAKLEHTTP
jgi:predicted ABC-type ATPase